MPRSAPYGAFNFVVKVSNIEFGGFSDVSGLMTELKMAEYREGADPNNYVQKLPGLHTAGDVTLKRGLVNSQSMFTWINQARSVGQRGFDAKQDVVITLYDEGGTAVQSWKLLRVLPLKYTGPTFAAKGGSDVAMEELVLSAEALELLESPSV